MRNRTIIVSLIATGLFLMAGLAEATGDCKEHPLIRPWPGSELEANCKYNNFNEYTLPESRITASSLCSNQNTFKVLLCNHPSIFQGERIIVSTNSQHIGNNSLDFW